MSKQVQNFHVPLPAGLYQQLRAEADRQKVPATTLAREAIAGWIEARQRQLREQEIRDYALEVAGSDEDFDPLLEAAAIEHLLEMDKL